MSKNIELENKYHFQNYKRLPLEISNGKGARVWDSNGNEYLDFLAGIAVNCLGHSHPKIIKVIREQSEKLIHCSNYFYTEAQSKLAEKLCLLSGLDRVMFSNSGAEAMEGAIKLARKYASDNGKTGKIYSMENAFHGRTLATIALGKQANKQGFEPMPEGFASIPMNDLEALDNIKNDAIAIVIEPVQGEGGVNIANKEYLQSLRQFCSDNNVLLIFDEVQAGIARTGKLFSYEHFGVSPDILTLAKGLGAGIPIGALLASEKIAQSFGYGSHGSTFGGNPFACAIALRTLEIIEEENILENVSLLGKYLLAELKEQIGNDPRVTDIRGIGLFCGVEFNFECRKLVEIMLKNGVISNCTNGNVLRIIPPLIITKNDIDLFIQVLQKSLDEI